MPVAHGEWCLPHWLKNNPNTFTLSKMHLFHFHLLAEKEHTARKIITELYSGRKIVNVCYAQKRGEDEEGDGHLNASLWACFLVSELKATGSSAERKATFRLGELVECLAGEKRHRGSAWHLWVELEAEYRNNSRQSRPWSAAALLWRLFSGCTL